MSTENDWTDHEPQNDCEALGEHQGERLTHDDGEGYRQYECTECGAEWWEDDEA